MTQPTDLPPSSPMTQPNNSKVTFTKLRNIDIRVAWPTEPSDFTPWLLENASELSEVLGVEVELDAREHKVGTFSLDLIGRVAGSDQVVIVENQYGQTDHTHLGQIMTYTGGTEPAIVVWIAEQFRDEHRAALDWLNENTLPDVRFFGVKLAAVRLDGADPSLVAPHLELVCKPNDWGKLAKVMAANTGSPTNESPINVLYKQFWEKFAQAAAPHSWTNATPPAANWWSLPSGTTGVQWSVSYSQFGCRSELYIGTSSAEKNLDIFHQLLAKQDEIKAAFGKGDLLFDDLPDKQACRLEVRLEGPKIGNVEQWETVIAWMVDTQLRMRAAVKAVGGIPT